MKDDPLADEPYSFKEMKDGRVHILHNNKPAVTLKGKAATRFSRRISATTPRDAQLAMAKATGQFRFGNERMGKQAGRGDPILPQG